MPFIPFPTIGKVLPSEDIKSVDVRFDIQTGYSLDFPQVSAGGIYIETKSVAHATLYATLRSGDEVKLKNIEIALGGRRDDFRLSSVYNDLPDEAKTEFQKRIIFCINYMQKTENHERMKVQAEAQPFEALVENTTSNFSVLHNSPNGPHTEKDTKNQELRLKKLNRIVESKTETHTGLTFEAALAYITDDSLLNPVIRELAEIAAQLNG